ncbi:MAG: zinc-dependent metalloprotease [Thermoguttaceae bacterium]
MKPPAAEGTSAVPPGTPPPGAPAAKPAAPKPGQIPFEEFQKEAKPITGLIPLYRKEDRLYGEFGPGLLDRDFIVLISIARGIGEGPLLGGMSWGEDWLWQFRKVEDKIQVVRRNVRFTAAKGSPEEQAVRLAYTDSILFSLPLVSTSPAGGSIVDLTPVFMSDLPQISAVLPGFTFARDRSSWASIKGFRNNVEIEVAATYASSGQVRLESVADTRAATINVHYSISQLPQTGYQPRLADPRVGYFVTAIKDYSKRYETDRFVRYINRWDLRKADPSAELSPPKKPIVFWLEKTIPFEYRKPIREGLLEWNKAFEKAGFANAIEVRQQPDDAEWDPEDINYNTFRWITSSAGFAMGPSRVNPLTGEILDADIIFDSDFLNFWKDEYDILRPREGRSAGTGQPDGSGRPPLHERLELLGWHADGHHRGLCQLSEGMGMQLALASVALQAGPKPASQEDFKKMVMQAVKEITMHEVGHTLGLRHNFKASSVYSLEEINNPEKTAQTGLAGSIMDYLPVNFMPKGHKQGDYFSTTLGPYDYWAIEYGYKPFPGGTDGELKELQKIASRAAEPALTYATDEDARFVDPDPLVNRFDLGSDPVAFAKMRRELVAQLVPGLVDRVTEPGEGYQRTRRAFNMLLHVQGTAMQCVSRVISGVYVHRSHKGDPGAKPPLVIVEPARQREAMAFLQEHVFGEKAFEFPPDLYNLLVEPRWLHWGIQIPERVDFPVRETMLAWQERILMQLLSSTTLERLIDSEIKVPPDQDAFTVPELFSGLTAAIFRELERLQQGEFTPRKPAISSLRRALQRRYLERLANLTMGNLACPEDCQTLAYIQLEAIEARINAVLQGGAKLDPYTQAHLKESASRIRRVLEARLQLRGP